jgi:hypothetical protein
MRPTVHAAHYIRNRAEELSPSIAPRPCSQDAWPQGSKPMVWLVRPTVSAVESEQLFGLAPLAVADSRIRVGLTFVRFPARAGSALRSRKRVLMTGESLSKITTSPLVVTVP